MLRIWLCLCLLLCASLSGGLLSAFAGEVCMQGCSDDDERGQCAPDCTDCTCCTHVRTAALAPASTEAPDGPRAPFIERQEDEPASADVGDILHVPIAILA